MNHHPPHGHGHEEDDSEPGQPPIDPDDGQAPAGLPIHPDQDGPVDAPI